MLNVLGITSQFRAIAVIVDMENICEICGFHGCEDSSLRLLVCDALWGFGRIPTFRRTLRSPFSSWRWTYGIHLWNRTLNLLNSRNTSWSRLDWFLDCITTMFQLRKSYRIKRKGTMVIMVSKYLRQQWPVSSCYPVTGETEENHEKLQSG
jgi:hypothetical protein